MFIRNENRACAFVCPHQESSWKRVAVVGTSGAGKTTFARSLAAITDAPHIELDPRPA